ncbi:DUF7321 family protein [Halorhabdus rudnickae]|uniref:DUF7321 family protein n=1 Tax=Halorhabdus rudnickae TaxID=1775544 RepID=UPI001FCEB361|nr:hypothetical protein [Halorhabdus rudnickae]
MEQLAVVGVSIPGVGTLVDVLAGIPDSTIALVVLVAVTLSLPCFLYGAWLMIVSDPITWGVLKRHLVVVTLGLALTTVPLVAWMIPKFWGQTSGVAVVHAFLGVQAYAFFVLAATGIVRILRAKWASAEFRGATDFELDALDDEEHDLGHWRGRLRIGVVGYTALWLLAYLTGLLRYALKYNPFG